MHARITSDCDFQTIRLEIEYPLGGGHGRPHLATMHRSTEIRFFHESMHGNYPDACKISMHVKSLLQTRIMHGIRLNQGYFIDFRRPLG